MRFKKAVQLAANFEEYTISIDDIHWKGFIGMKKSIAYNL